MSKNIMFLFFFLLVSTAIFAAGPMENGETYFLKARYGLAASSYKKALTYDINNNNRANCWYMLGQSYLMMGEFKNARYSFSKITSKYPKTYWLSKAYIGLGDACYHEKKYSDAIKYYKKAMTSKYMAMHGSTVYYKLAKAYRAINYITKAKSYETIIRDKYSDSLESRITLQNKGGSSSSSKKYAVQVAYSTRADFAQDCSKKYKKKGYDAYVEVTSSKGKTRYKILVGRYSSKEAAEFLMKKIRTKEKIAAFVTTVSDD
jgi:tetratricopeptide (TPR) repeat protein